MPKYEAKIVCDKDGNPIVDKDGKVRSVAVPIDDAAKANRAMIQEAIDLKLYKPAKGEEPEEMREKLLKKEKAAAAKGIGLPK